MGHTILINSALHLADCQLFAHTNTYKMKHRTKDYNLDGFITHQPTKSN